MLLKQFKCQTLTCKPTYQIPLARRVEDIEEQLIRFSFSRFLPTEICQTGKQDIVRNLSLRWIVVSSYGALDRSTTAVSKIKSTLSISAARFVSMCCSRRC